LAAFGLLAGCGGGGGDTKLTPANLSSAPGDSAIAAYLQASHHSTLTATDTSNNTDTLQLDQVANAGTTTFNGSAPAYSFTGTVTLSQNGTVVATAVDTSYFLLNPVIPLGKVNSTGSPYAIVTSSTPIPMTLTVGTSGSFDNVTYYHDSTKAMIDAMEVSTYTVAANDSMSLQYCVKSVISGTTAQGTADGMGDSSENDCYNVTAAGVATLVSVAVTVNGSTLTFK
jgi:hypothetical protein